MWTRLRVGQPPSSADNFFFFYHLFHFLPQFNVDDDHVKSHNLQIYKHKYKYLKNHIKRNCTHDDDETGSIVRPLMIVEQTWRPSNTFSRGPHFTAIAFPIYNDSNSNFHVAVLFFSSIYQFFVSNSIGPIIAPAISSPEPVLSNLYSLI